jgi:hypothetical protein
MARAALQWSLDDVQAASGVSRRTVLRLEQNLPIQRRNAQGIRAAFENAGVRFIDEGPDAGGIVPPARESA